MKKLLFSLAIILLLALSFNLEQTCASQQREDNVIQKIIDEVLKEGLRTGAFGCQVSALSHENIQDPDYKQASGIYAWFYYLNAHRILSQVYEDQSLDQNIRAALTINIQSVTQKLFVNGKNAFQWNEAQTKQKYEYFVGLMNERIEFFENCGAEAKSASSPQAKQTKSSGKPLPFSNSDFTAAILEKCQHILIPLVGMEENPDFDPKQIRDTIEQCLSAQGYDYIESLRVLADGGFSMYRDFNNMQFLTLPAGGARKKNVPLDQVFSKKEIDYLMKIKEQVGGGFEY